MYCILLVLTVGITEVVLVSTAVSEVVRMTVEEVEGKEVIVKVSVMMKIVVVGDGVTTLVEVLVAVTVVEGSGVSTRVLVTLAATVEVTLVVTVEVTLVVTVEVGEMVDPTTLLMFTSRSPDPSPDPLIPSPI